MFIWILTNSRSRYNQPDKSFHSCDTALIRVQNGILLPIDNRHCVMLLLLDLSAAFDTANHEILLKRLNSKISICGTALDWFRSYLTNRTQVVLIDGRKSQSHELKCGVPQGSVLGPILYMYLLCTAPLADILRFHNMQFHFYPDDTQLYISFSANDNNNNFISNQIKCSVLWRGENRSSRRKTSRSRVENQQTQPTYDAGSGNGTRDTLVEGKRSNHCANPAPLSR